MLKRYAKTISFYFTKIGNHKNKCDINVQTSELRNGGELGKKDIFCSKWSSH